MFRAATKQNRSVGRLLPDLAVATLLALLLSACGSTSDSSAAADDVGSDTVGASIEPAEDSPSIATPGITSADSEVTPFTDVARQILKRGSQLWNVLPGAVIFDYDRDGDLDLYLTTDAANPNRLYRNGGDGSFTDVADVAEEAGVAALGSNSTGAIACDVDNDGYQDLYVGAGGDPSDGLDFRSPSEGQGNKDHLFLNLRDGTFRDITDSAFGDAVNLRSAASIACADVDGDGWLDIYVGNLGDNDFRKFDRPSHAGHYNALYHNNGDLTFTELAGRAGVRGHQIMMRDLGGRPILFDDPETGERYEGWDPTVMDKKGNQVGEPAGQTHAALFFDHDDDGDPDLWVANDGDRLDVYRNDSSPGSVRFTAIAKPMGVDKVGAWMGFAVGDYDGDADLDVFATNFGYHPRLRAPAPRPTGSCEYYDRFEWGTCLLALFRNEGTRDVPGLGTVGIFKDVAADTIVSPSPFMPPDSLERSNIYPSRQVPEGLGAYDFGFGTTFFDYNNDGYQDLYWLGSLARGNGPGGQVLPSAGRMLRGDGRGSFEDITVRAHLLDILNVDYSMRDAEDLRNNPLDRRMNARFHENGKGVAHGDLNGDGYVDLVGTNSSGPIWDDGNFYTIQILRGPVFLWLNGGGDNHWIALRLKGRMAIDGSGSNADGIGARVYLTAGLDGEGDRFVQVQEVRAGSSYLSMDSIDLEFGLGAATEVDEITVLWPSGRTQILTDLSVDQVLVITEPDK